MWVGGCGDGVTEINIQNYEGNPVKYTEANQTAKARIEKSLQSSSI